MLEQGELLRGRYKIIRRLGQGGMGAVYEAHDNVFDTSVALKEVTVDLSNAYDTKAQEMAQAAFEREAKLLAKIAHETIPHVKDYFIEKEAQFLIMELVDGDDLGKLLKERNAAFPVGTIIEWTEQLLDALDYIHSQNPPIIHRDIKPQNLKLTSRKKIKLLDFGIAKGTEAQASNTITNQTFIAATLNYSPIEQMVRVLDPTFLAVITHKYTDQIETILEQNADARTDLYALGATLYHLATNKQPTEAVKRGIEIWDGKPDPLENPSILNPEIPSEFSDFLLKAMQINRNHRFNSADEMREELSKIKHLASKPTLSPTVEMNMADFQTQDTQADFKPITAENEKPITGQNQPQITVPPSNEPKTEVFEAPISGEVVTEIAPPERQQQYQRQQQEQYQQQQQFVGNSQNVSTVSDTTYQEKKKSNKLLWLIPALGLILVMFVGGALGVWLIYKNYNGGVTDTNTNTETTETNTDSGNSEVNADTGNTDSGNSDLTLGSNTETGNTDSGNSGVNTSSTPTTSSTATTSTKTPTTSNPTPKPTVKATPKPTQIVKQPTVKPTVKPTQKKTPKNMDCILTDSCE